MTGSEESRLEKLREDVDLLFDMVEGNKRSGHKGLITRFDESTVRQKRMGEKLDELLDKEKEREKAEEARHEQRTKGEERNRRIFVAFVGIASTVISGLLIAVLTQLSGLS